MGVTIIGILTRKRGTSHKKRYFLKQGKKRKPLNFPVDTTCNASSIPPSLFPHYKEKKVFHTKISLSSFTLVFR